jgi:hypothetical protein
MVPSRSVGAGLHVLPRLSPLILNYIAHLDSIVDQDRQGQMTSRPEPMVARRPWAFVFLHVYEHTPASQRIQHMASPRLLSTDPRGSGQQPANAHDREASSRKEVTDMTI